VIISASYKTDIPTFYGEWFMNRVRAGYCKMVNPYGRQIYRVDLSRDAVDGFVFWTKNIGPFLAHLDEIHSRGFPFMIQYTINGYPRTLESSVVNAVQSVEHMKRIADRFGPRRAVWRYDTIIFSSITSVEFHRKNFEMLAKALKGTTDEVVVSFVQLYKKTLRNMNSAAEKFDFTWEDPPDNFKFSFASELAGVAQSYGIQLSMCAQRQFLAPGVTDAKCVDSQRLTEIAGKPILAKQQGNRPECGCFYSKDIGEYDTCPHGCVYCYAVQNRDLAQQRHKEHDPQGEFLFTPENYVPGQSDLPLKHGPAQSKFSFD
jgi:hypothetical protein